MEEKPKVSTPVKGGITNVGKRKLRATKFNWLKIKRDYISDPTATSASISEKYKVYRPSLVKKMTEEKWSLLREEVQHKAELSLAGEAEADVLEVKKRHVRIARLMQKVGLEALENYKPKDSKEAREFLIEGIKIEKQAMGIDQNKNAPAIFGIMTQEKAIIGKYQDIQEGEVVK